MANSRYIDPSTGDYVLVRGTPRPDDTVASEVVLALRSRRRDGYGSRLHTITKLTPSSARLAEVYAREAIAHLIERAEVRDPRFTVELDENRYALRVTVAYRNGANRSQQVPVTVPIR